MSKLFALLVVSILATAAVAQVGQEMQDGTIRAQLDTYPPSEGLATVRVSVVSQEQATIGFDITLIFSINGEIRIRTASPQYAKERCMWVMQYFVIPAGARVISFGVLERKEPTMFKVDMQL